MKITWIYAPPSGKSNGRDRKNYAASVLTQGRLNNADRSDDLLLVGDAHSQASDKALKQRVAVQARK